MRHQRSGKKLGRDSAHRRALYANLASNLIEHERIKTTLTKAKAVKPIAEQMITLGRRGDIHARRQAVAFLGSKDIVHKLFDELGPRYAERPGGYTRIVRLGPRLGDAAEVVYLELVDTPLVFKTKLEDVKGPVAGLDAGDEDEFESGEAEEAEEAGEIEEADEEANGEEPEAESEGAEPEAESATAVEDEVAAAAEPEEPQAEAESAAEAEAVTAEPEADAEPEAESKDV
jgi:large subunit ribosomal protein L17